MSENQQLGGARALYGFYYQFLGSMHIANLDIYRCSPVDPYNVMLGFESQQEKSYFPELLGQDLLVAAGTHKALVQFKSSLNPATHSIEPSDLKEILLSFASSWDAAPKWGIPKGELSGCLLVTNRPLSKDSANIVEAVKQLRVVNNLPSDGLNGRTLPVNTIAMFPLVYKGNETTLGDIAVDWATKESTGAQSKVEGSNAESKVSVDQDLRKTLLTVLLHFHVRSNVQISHFTETFERLSDAFGVLPSERKDAEGKLVSKVLESSLGHPIPFHKEDIVEALTGTPDALPLTLEGIGPNCQTSLTKWTLKLRGDDVAAEEKLIQRDLSEVFDALEEKRIVILSGPGGCGKTESLIAVCQNAARYLSDDIKFQGFPLIEYTRSLRNEDWVGSEVGRWANRQTTTEKVPTRLRLANPNRKRLLLLAVDGWDEHQLSASLLDKLLTLVKAPENDDIRLLITCREAEARNIRIGFGEDATGSGQESANTRSVSLSDFKPEELYDAVGKALGKEYQARFTEETPNGRIQPGRLYSPTILDPDVRNSLAHPRMLGAWSEFRNQKATLNAALEGDSTALREIARVFLMRFFKKYWHRQYLLPGFRLQDHARMYQVIALNARNPVQSVFYGSDWADAARRYQGLGQIDPSTLFKEADSGGLIVVAGDDYEWYWRHKFVADCLAEDDLRKYIPND